MQGYVLRERLQDILISKTSQRFYNNVDIERGETAIAARRLDWKERRCLMFDMKEVNLL